MRKKTLLKNTSHLIGSALLASLLLTGCESLPPAGETVTKEQLEEMKKVVASSLQDALSVSGEKLEELSQKIDPNDPLKELRKLRQIEYKVVTLPLSDSVLETELNALGKLSWDCFHGERVPPLSSRSSDTPSASPTAEETPRLALLCKRRAETPLHYIPQQILGR